MGLPRITVNFIELGVSAIKRSGRGVVVLILKDDTVPFKTKHFKRLDEVDKDYFTADNYDLIRLVFMGTPSKVIVETMNTTTDDVNNVLKRVKTLRFNYLAMPSATDLEKTELATFIKNSDREDKKTFKAVLAKNKADHECVINFTSEEIRVGEKLYSTEEYTARMAGLFAGISLDRSATYYVLPEVDSVKAKEDPDASIDAGELILIDDGEKVKIARAVNSLTTITTLNGRMNKGASFKKIKIVEGIHLVKDDIRTTFADDYVGKYINDYDNKVLFITAINAYFKQLQKEYILDKSYQNKALIDEDAHIIYIEGQGVSTESMTEQDIKEYNTGSNVLLKANARFVDAMEDLDFDIYM